MAGIKRKIVIRLEILSSFLQYLVSQVHSRSVLTLVKCFPNLMLIISAPT